MRDADVGACISEVRNSETSQDAEGFQSLISIQDSGAPISFEFSLQLPSGSGLTMEKDGSVSIRDAEGNDIGGIAKPWATDAKGAAVPTHFTTKGNNLVQIIDHGPGTAYPVIADPKGFWGWAKCIGVVASTLAGNSLLIAKVAQVVRRFGSLKKTMQIAYKAFKQAPNGKKHEAIVKAIGSVGAELFGIGPIRTACFT